MAGTAKPENTKNSLTYCFLQQAKSHQSSKEPDVILLKKKLICYVRYSIYNTSTNNYPCLEIRSAANLLDHRFDSV